LLAEAEELQCFGVVELDEYGKVKRWLRT